MSSGKIVQIIGAVIDVEFSRESVPQVYDAERLSRSSARLSTSSSRVNQFLRFMMP